MHTLYPCSRVLKLASDNPAEAHPRTRTQARAVTHWHTPLRTARAHKHAATLPLHKHIYTLTSHSSRISAANKDLERSNGA